MPQCLPEPASERLPLRGGHKQRSVGDGTHVISMILMAGNEPEASLGKRLEALALSPLLCVVTLGIGWMVWNVFEWRNGRTPTYRLLRLHVVRLSDGEPIGLGRSIVRSGICCLLLVPTVAVCAIVGISFVFGASAPDNLFRDPRRAPWDHFTRTKVTSERAEPLVGGEFRPGLKPIDLATATKASNARYN
jgi:RDD family